MKVREGLERLIQNIDPSGQWPIGILLNGKEEFWAIDMALAGDSVLKDCVPAWLLKPTVQDWIPRLPGGGIGADVERGQRRPAKNRKEGEENVADR